jgi:uncharacterized protein (TIGR02246 family)
MWEIARAIAERSGTGTCGTLEERLRRLEAEAELRDLQARYVQALDAGDLEAIMRLFTDDCTLINPRGTFVGADAVRGDYQSVLARTRLRLHYPANLTIRLFADGEEAWTMAHNYALIVSRSGELTAGAGTTAERLVRSDGQWKIRDRRMTTNIGHVLTPQPFRLQGPAAPPTSPVTSHDLIGRDAVL